MKPILIRASSAGAIMTEPKLKSETISQTAKAKLIELFINEKYGRTKDINSKYLTKGTAQEWESIQLYARYKDTFLTKNTERKENSFITGLCDINSPTIGADVKSSWDIFTFLASKHSAIDKDYYWQMQCYMELYDKPEWFLVYCLVNDSAESILDQKRRLQYKHRIIEEETPEYISDCIELEKNSIYDFDLFLEQNEYFEFHADIFELKRLSIPESERVHEIRIERDRKAIKKLYERIELCRSWINQTLLESELIIA